ncbi:MAG: hypothetical protein ACKVZ6_10885 [Kineosporiaceae bacterium]
MTARTTGRQARPSRPAGSSAPSKRPAKRPATAAAAPSAEPAARPADAAAQAPAGTVSTVAEPAAAEPAAAEPAVAEPAAAEPAVAEPAAVPPIDARVLLQAIMTPPAGIADGESLTDALTGAVPTWRLDEEPIYLEVIRDLGVPAVPQAQGGAGEVIVGEVVAG